MNFIDKAPITGTRLTNDGYLVASVKAARTGIQLYAGHEVGDTSKPVVKVYRPEAEVFKSDSLSSYAHKPITNDHPDEAVSADNWKDLAVGQLGDEVARDGDYVRIPLIVMDAAAIKLVQDGKQELSAGYTCDLAFEPGVTKDGEAYDAVQRNIKINHVAIVKSGRAGSEARIGDNAVKSWGVSSIPQTKDERIVHMDVRKITVDGIPVETNDAGATVIEKLQKDKTGLQSQLDALNTKLADELKAKDAELAKKDATIDGLKAKVLDESAMDAAVIARADLIASAKSVVADIDTTGKSAADIRKTVVAAKIGDAAIKDKSEAYIDARFDMLVEDAGAGNETADAVRNLRVVNNDSRGAEVTAYDKANDDLNSWRNKA